MELKVLYKKIYKYVFNERKWTLISDFSSLSMKAPKTSILRTVAQGTFKTLYTFQKKHNKHNGMLFQLERNSTVYILQHYSNYTVWEWQC